MKPTSMRTPNSARPKGARNKFFRADQERKRKEAEARQAASDALSPTERLERLDRAFGKGVGATKERAKLRARIEFANKKLKDLMAIPEKVAKTMKAAKVSVTIDGKPVEQRKSFSYKAC